MHVKALIRDFRNSNQQGQAQLEQGESGDDDLNITTEIREVILIFNFLGFALFSN